MQNGRNWVSIAPGTVAIFHYEGVRGRGQMWRIAQGATRGREIKPKEFSRQIIAASLAQGKMRTAKVSAQIAVLLYLEGVLTVEHLLASEETPETITCNDVLFSDERYRRVVIRRDLGDDKYSVS